MASVNTESCTHRAVFADEHRHISKTLHNIKLQSHAADNYAPVEDVGTG